MGGEFLKISFENISSYILCSPVSPEPKWRIANGWSSSGTALHEKPWIMSGRDRSKFDAKFGEVKLEKWTRQNPPDGGQADNRFSDFWIICI